MLAQSVGGGGGNGGFSITGSGAKSGAGSLGVGGYAGDGGDGKAVTVTNSGNIYTYGEGAAGLFSQSVGGGGGTGGFSIAGSGAKTGSGTFSLGGGGGAGGSADVVSLTNNGGSVTTYGTRAYGVIAQSVGGGGGAGGFSFSGGVTTDGFSVSASVGGFGGVGGDGGYANLVNHGVVKTTSDDAHALVSQSIGGGGGSGGFSGSLSASAGSKPNVSLSVGGFGGAAGNADKVDLFNDAELATSGVAAYGLFAQSIGGGGGDGGGSLALALGKHDGAANVSASYGGSGAAAGDGTLVNVFNAGTVNTTGAKAHGLVAQSVGGGGGNGGFSITGVLAKGTNTKDLSVSVGGFGGAGGDAGEVVVTNDGYIHAQGLNASGIVAQSLGGGGGNGGFSFAGSFAGAQAKDLGISVGGFGGAAGKGQDVTVHNTGVIETGLTSVVELALPQAALMSQLALDESDLPPLPDPPPPPPLLEEPEALLIERYATYTAYGIFAQSVGGGGGDGGTSVSVGTGFGGTKDTWNVNSAVGVGGEGGTGNIGGYVGVTNENTVTTLESDSHAIFAQSVGGGGGKGGGSYTATVGFGAANEGRSFNGNLTVGGKGGNGNLGGEVYVNNTGLLQTYGDMSDGIRAQSIGGGGGSGGSAHALNYLFKAGSAKLEEDQAAGKNVKTQIAVGGNGGEGNDGGTVRVVNSGGIVTRGASARGIFAQSIGGGGGSGGDGILGTGTAADSYLLLANLLEDMGGGGNVITKFLKGQLRNLSVAVGGNEGSKGDADSVTIENTGDITTYGYGATAIMAQSVGGGGGDAQSFASGEDAGGKAYGGAFGKIAIGGAGGSGGNGGAVNVNNDAIITTDGDAAHGIFAQSVGGGGGTAGNVERALSSSLDIGLGLDFGRSGGGAGDGGTVTVTSGGSITTRGADAYGIFAQSVGGGGGVASSLSTLPDLITPLVGLTGSVGGYGSAGEVDITHVGNITTSGYASHGIFAQSAGGKQSDNDTTDYLGVGGQVTVELDGDIDVQNADADGIFAQSVGIDGADDINVNIKAGHVSGGSGSGVGVRFDDGAENLLTNHGSVMALSGMAIAGGDENETIDNYGIVTGNVDLGSGVNVFNNHAGAQFNASENLVLGAGNVLDNNGTLSPGGAGSAFAMSLEGNFVQFTSGSYATDLDLLQETTDHVNVTGTADLAGAVDIKIVNGGWSRPGTQQHIILVGEEGVTNSGLELAFAPSAVADHSLLFSSPTEVAVSTSIDFSPAGLNKNQTAIANHVNAIQLAGGSESFAPVADALLARPSLGKLASSYDQLSPGIYLDTAIASLFTNLQFSDAMLSCRERSGDYRFVREGECRWMQLSTRRLERDRTRQNSDFDEWTVGLAGGMQKAIGGDWHAGFALSYGHSKLDNDNGGESDGNTVQAGAILKGRSEATTYSVAMSGGYGWYNTRRDIDFMPTPERAKGDQEIGFASVHVRLAHAFEKGDWYLRPQIDAGVTYVDLGDFNERGANGANLDVKGHNETYTSLQPAVEVGQEIKRRDGTLVRPFAKLGFTHFFSGTTPEVSAVFQGAPAGVSPFTVKGDIDETFADVSLGLDILKEDGINFRLNYLGQFSGDMKNQGLGFKVTVPF